jgi:hypothetical protein
MQAGQDKRTEAALYWAAVSLIVCEGLPMREAAHRLGIAHEELRGILDRRREPESVAKPTAQQWVYERSGWRIADGG